MSELKAVVFDLDDTLYPEMDFVVSGFHAVADWAASKWDLEAEEVAVQLDTLFRAGIRGNTFGVWLSQQAREDLLAEVEMVRIYREHVPNIAPFPETHGILQGLRQRYRLGLVSDGILHVQRTKLQALRLEEYLDAVVFSDEYGRASWKPSPLPFETILNTLNVRPFEAVYVADNVAKDFVAPNRIGMGTIRVWRSTGLYNQVEAATPQHAPQAVISDLSQLPAQLGSWPWA